MVQLRLDDVHKMCMVHILFKHQYMRMEDFRAKCLVILGSDSGARKW